MKVRVIVRCGGGPGQRSSQCKVHGQGRVMCEVQGQGQGHCWATNQLADGSFLWCWSRWVTLTMSSSGTLKNKQKTTTKKKRLLVWLNDMNRQTKPRCASKQRVCEWTGQMPCKSTLLWYVFWKGSPCDVTLGSLTTSLGSTKADFQLVSCMAAAMFLLASIQTLRGPTVFEQRAVYACECVCVCARSCVRQLAWVLHVQGRLKAFFNCHNFDRMVSLSRKMRLCNRTIQRKI